MTTFIKVMTKHLSLKQREEIFEQREQLYNEAVSCPFPHQMPEDQGSGWGHGSSSLKFCQTFSYKSNEKYKSHLDMQNFARRMCVFWKQAPKKSCMRSQCLIRFVQSYIVKVRLVAETKGQTAQGNSMETQG